MKTRISCFLILLQIIVSEKLISQQSNKQTQPYSPLKSVTSPVMPMPTGYTPNGVMDNIFDMYGNKYKFEDIMIEKPIRNGNNGSKTNNQTQIQSSPPPTATCSAGYFNLYFETGSGMEGGSAIEVSRRNVICQLYSDLSAFIISPLTASGNKVNIFVRDMTNMGIANPGTNATAGLASPFFVVPTVQNIGGIVDNTIWQTINSGTDAYKNVMSPLYTSSANGGNFYHGQISINFANPAFQWHTNLGATTASGMYDLYTVALHETIHALGFGSLIDQNGNSKFGATFPYYSRYDTYLKTQSGLTLIKNNGSCSMYNWTWNGALNPSVMEPNYPGPGGCTPDNTNCSFAINYAGSITQAVYTPDCWSGGSSLSHFEDQCMTPPQGNNQYFVMANATGTGPTFMKRFPKPQERSALCDMGYRVNGTYGSAPNLNFYNYGSSCPGNGVAGINDGITPGGAYQFVTPVGSPINITALGANPILTNDYFSTGSGNTFTCVQIVSGNGSLSGITPTSFNYQPNAAGLHLLRYVPVNASGRKGNITYLYIYASSGNCTPSSCNIVNNGGFESGTNCGQWTQPPYPTLNCWDYLYATPDYYVRGCGSSPWTVPTGVLACNPPSESWSGIPGNNNAFLGLWYVTAFGGMGEAMQNQLSSPIMPNIPYTLTFRAKVTPNFNSGNSNNPGTLQFNGSPLVNLAPNFSGFPTLTYGQFLCTATVTNNAAWNLITVTFTYTGTQPLNSLLVANVSGIDNYTFIDDVSIVPSNNVVSFNLPTSVCQNNSLLNLGAYGSIPGTFTGAGVTFSGGAYQFNAAANLAPGTYTVTYNYTINNCPGSSTKTIDVVPSGTITASSSSTLVCANLGGNTTLNANANPAPPAGVTYTWQPGGGTGSSIVVSPAVTTIYTVSVAYPGGCTATQTVQVNVSNSCCPQSTLGTIPLVGTNFIPAGTTLNGPYIIDQNVTLGTGAMVSLSNGEFLIAPNVNITIPNGAQLKLDGAHLYACATDMWDGIVVQNGGSIVSVSTGPNVTLIEDAKVAIDLSNIPSIIQSSPLEITGMIFNKNHVAVNISNVSVNTIGMILRSCVFTSRALPFTPTSWPNSSVISPGLRAAINPTTGLVAPYTLQGYPVTNLINPYSYQSAHIGIQISNVANNPGATPVNGIDLAGTNPSGVNDFNLFDALGIGIDVTNGSIITANNVFQNMQYYNTPNGPFGGIGIRHTTNSTMNGFLGLEPASPNVGFDFGNRFWDCYTAIEANNLFRMNVKQCLFRSTQNQANGMGWFPGSYGIKINTNKHQYTIDLNEFENLNTAISFNLSPGMYDVGGAQFGIYGGNTTINQNYIAPQVTSSIPLSTEYANQAIIVTGPNSGVTNTIGRMDIFSNQIDRVYRGISVDGMDKYPVLIDGNLIGIVDDIMTGGVQRGIEIVKTIGYIEAQQNILTGTGLNNTMATLVYLDDNQGNPFIACNDLSNCYEGFVFSQYNMNSTWMGNLMTNLDRGMSLINNGSCGPQGNPGTPSDNQWLGTWNPPSYSTFVDMSSNAASSQLFVNPSSPFVPTVNGINPGADYNGTPWLNFSSPGSAWKCPMITLPTAPSYKSASNPTSINNGGLKAGGLNIDVYPNPTTGNVNIVGTKESQTLKVTVIDVTGKIILKKNITTSNYTSSLMLDVNQGVYFIEILGDNNLRTTRKLVIQK